MSKHHGISRFAGLAIVVLMLNPGCGSDDDDSNGAGATGGSGGTATGGSGGSATGGTAGQATGGTAGQATGGTAGQATGGTAGQATGGTAGQATGGTAGQATGGTAGQATGGTAGQETGGTAGQATGGTGGQATGGTGGQATGGTGGGGTGSECDTLPSKDECDACCQTETPAGPAAMAEMIAACLCQPTFCETPCADFCADPPAATDFAPQCMDCYSSVFHGSDYQACFMDANDDCQSDVTCAAFSACITSCMGLP